MKRWMVITISIVLLIYIIGCGVKNSQDLQTKSESNLTYISWCSGYSIPVPKPDTEYIVTYDYGTYCYGIDTQMLKDYLGKLEADGWSCRNNTVLNNKPHYTYVKDDMILQIVDNTIGDSFPEVIERNTSDERNNSGENTENKEDKDNNAAGKDKEISEDKETGDVKKDGENIEINEAKETSEAKETNEIKETSEEKEISEVEETREVNETRDEKVASEGKEDAALSESYIIVNFSNGYEKIQQRVDALSKGDASKLIKEHIKQLANTDGEYETAGGSKVSMIVERFLEDSYEKMGLQAFTVLNDSGKLIGTYLICNKSVLYVLDSLTEVCVADIEEDGEYELLSLYGWGSGLYRIELSAYKCVNPDYFNSLTKVLQCVYRNCFVPIRGYGKLSFKKINATEVRLLDHDWQSEEKDNYTGEPVDYGKIFIDTDGYHLIPEKLEEFPYDQWDYSYDQENILSAPDGPPSNESGTLVEPPLINISIGETKLNYKVSMILWNGEKFEDNINFYDLMQKEEIPQFDSPENGLAFKDPIILDFGDSVPKSIEILDNLLTNTGGIKYSNKLAIEREAKIEGDGKFSFGLFQHFALMLSSNSATYENPSYRGFCVTCTFSEDKICKYYFVLRLGSIW